MLIDEGRKNFQGDIMGSQVSQRVSRNDVWWYLAILLKWTLVLFVILKQNMCYELVKKELLSWKYNHKQHSFSWEENQ